MDRLFFLVHGKTGPGKSTKAAIALSRLVILYHSTGTALSDKSKRPFVKLSPNPWSEPTFTNSKLEPERNTSLVSPASAGAGNHSSTIQLIPRPYFSQLLLVIFLKSSLFPSLEYWGEIIVNKRETWTTPKLKKKTTKN